MAQTFEEQYEQMIQKQLTTMMQAFLDAQKTVASQTTSTSKSSATAADQQQQDDRIAAVQGKSRTPLNQLAFSEAKPRDKGLHFDLENLNQIDLPRDQDKPTYSVRPSGSRGGYMDRARRSIKNESRQTNLVDLVAAFNDIPKKRQIKIDLEKPLDTNKALDPYKYQRSELNIEYLPVQILEDSHSEKTFTVVGSSQIYSKNVDSVKDQSCSTDSNKTFLRDYEGEYQKTIEGIEEKKGETAADEDTDTQIVDHILNRLVNILMLPGASSDPDFIREDQTDGNDDVNYESLLMQKIRLSGQAKSVRCLSSHIRQKNVKLRDKSKGAEAERDGLAQLHSCASNVDPTLHCEGDDTGGKSLAQVDHFQTLSRSRADDKKIVGHRSARPDQKITTGGLYQHPNRRHFRAQELNHISLATPVVRGVKSSELELEDVLVLPFEYGGDAQHSIEANQAMPESAKKINFVSRRESCAQQPSQNSDPITKSVKKQQLQSYNVAQRNSRLSLTGNQFKEIVSEGIHVGQVQTSQAGIHTEPHLNENPEGKSSKN